MKYKFSHVFLFLIFLLCAYAPYRAFAADSPIVSAVSSQEACPSEEIILEINYPSAKNFEVLSKGFSAEVTFDSGMFTQPKISAEEPFKRRAFKIDKNQGKADIIYNPKKPTENINFGGGKILQVRFKVKCRASAGKTDINVSAFLPGENSTVYSQKITCTINESKASKECRLKDLKCSSENLSPSFNPEIFEYEISVPGSVSDVTTNAVAAKENLDIKVSRHRLAPPDTTTDIKITVSDKKEKAKAVYTLHVHRGEKAPTSPKVKKSSGSKKKSKNKYDSSELNEDYPNDEVPDVSYSQGESENSVEVNDSNNKKYMTIFLITLIAGVAVYTGVRIISERREKKNAKNKIESNK